MRFITLIISSCRAADIPQARWDFIRDIKAHVKAFPKDIQKEAMALATAAD